MTFNFEKNVGSLGYRRVLARLHLRIKSSYAYGCHNNTILLSNAIAV